MNVPITIVRGSQLGDLNKWLHQFIEDGEMKPVVVSLIKVASSF